MKLHPLLAAGLLALSATSALAQPTGEPVVTGETHAIASTIMGVDRRVTVRLPAGYAEQPEMRFPVVYVMDGGPEQDFIHIAGIVQSRDMNWSFERFILVGIETVNRRAEISPNVRAEALEEYKVNSGATPGGADKFRQYLAQDVKPWVEANFRTNGHDALMGESLAGLFVVETLFAQPDMFDDWIAVSPSLWWDDMKLARGAKAHFAAMPTSKERLYLTLGNEGYRHEQGVERLVDALRSDAPEGWRWAYVPLTDSETHGTIYHTAALDAFRLFYGTEDREYPPLGDLSDGSTPIERTEEAQAMLDTPCTAQNTTHLTPGAAARAREGLFYRCLRLDLGPRMREGNWND